MRLWGRGLRGARSRHPGSVRRPPEAPQGSDRHAGARGGLGRAGGEWGWFLPSGTGGSLPFRGRPGAARCPAAGNDSRPGETPVASGVTEGKEPVVKADRAPAACGPALFLHLCPCAGVAVVDVARRGLGPCVRFRA